ncbi:BURP domain-containing protein 10 [Dichanthelium oligosanthes]|uniref:BURP domain-containing protein 10 n=1 Tax=Dichanthelium oligosanthes TaxID=888268 RepID=A0A1E5WDQ9_9POAL|nr:BURP domain-containing protein 10 [Dichanthelium oligosanthes]
MSASEVAAYWQTACPNSAMPSAILHHLSAPVVVEGHRSVHHGARHNHGHFDLADLCFSEDTSAPGSTVTPYILPAASHAPFLRHEVAESIRMSLENFTDILGMFAPAASPSAARDSWTTLDVCEHPDLLEGEHQGCVASMESIVELVASVLGTRDVQAPPTCPRGGPQVRAAWLHGGVRAEDHSRTPCSTATRINPARVYDVTLRSTTGEKKAMRVLAVCHLDTSGFHPANPFFVERGIKPGDIPLCHFLSKDTPPLGAHRRVDNRHRMGRSRRSRGPGCCWLQRARLLQPISRPHHSIRWQIYMLAKCPRFLPGLFHVLIK